MMVTINSQRQRQFQFKTFAIFLLVSILSPPIQAQFSIDIDNDGIVDSQDNCIEVANPDQRDTDNDTYGNLCDADLNNDLKTNYADSVLFDATHPSKPDDNNYNFHADFNGDNEINNLDLKIFKKLHGRPPGPSGVKISLTPSKASRFLTQSSFGPTLSDINHLLSLGNYIAWLNEQFLEPITLQLPAMRSMMIKMCDVNETDPPAITGGNDLARAQVWWNTTVNGKDQLRQRVALALSEILVVSGRGALTNSQLGLADYYDVLAKNAFGNYRDLIEEITLHPAMGRYLGMLRNEKANLVQNTRPDENYAREIMQLFTLGVYELNIDGSLVLDEDNKPVPIYGQSDIEEFAKIYTGWDFNNATSWRNLWIGNGDTIHPMIAFEQFHDSSEKNLLDGFVIAAGGSAMQDLNAALDHLFNHKNIAPFISKQLIQRLVTSNPTKEYVERVAKVFNNNGANEKGDLKAVIKAILLDVEARNGNQTLPESFGKMREPILRISHLWRAFPVMPVILEGPFFGGDLCGQGEYEFYKIPYPRGLNHFDSTLGQTILRSPTVFNFFLPDYSPPGAIRDQNLVAPEFQILTENNLVNTFNAIISMVHNSNRPTTWNWTTIDTTLELALADTPEELLNHLNLVLLNDLMSVELRQILTNHLGQVFPEGAEGQQAKVTDSIKLIVTSPEYLIQQ